MKLPKHEIFVENDTVDVFDFFTNSKYQYMWPKFKNTKIVKIKHLNSKPYGEGKKLEYTFTDNHSKFNVELEIYKYQKPNYLGYKLIDISTQKSGKNNSIMHYYLGEHVFDISICELKKGASIRIDHYINNTPSLFLSFMMYFYFGILGYLSTRKYFKKIGKNIEKIPN
ncbi:MAG: hypothetical protein SVR94_09345 [Pseudomonadota bacterium]|nr:hypothetical protein [Pseudomonadota bacterium]